MKNRFVVAVAGLTEEGEKAFLSYLNERGAGWWHLVPNFWLIIDNQQKLDAASMRSFLTAQKATKTLVMHVPDDYTWAGYGNAGDFDWINTNWTGD